MRYQPQDRDILQTLFRRIAELERQIEHLRSQKAPTAPVYDLAALPPGLQDGQYWITTSNKWYFRNGGSNYNAGPQVMINNGVLKNGLLRRVVGDLIKMSIIAGVALLVAFWRSAEATNKLAKDLCISYEHIRSNQKVVLTNLVAIVLSLSDREKVGLRPLPPETLDSLIDALGRIPDECNA